MAANSARHREALGELLNLAQTYRGCTRKQLAAELGRDASNLIPDSGVPKVDLVIELARVLDWPVEDVVGAVWGTTSFTAPRGRRKTKARAAESGFEELDRLAMDAHRGGRYREMIDFAGAAYKKAETAEERVRACNREAGGWDGLGQYRFALEALQRGVRETGVSRGRQLLLRANLANAYYTLWQLFEANGVAADVLDSLEREPCDDRPARIAAAMAWYVRGHCWRRLIGQEPERAAAHARRAIEDLERAEQAFHQLAEADGDDSYAGVANTCRGGMLEAKVVLGAMSAGEALDSISDALDALVDPDDYPRGDWLESWGWWCIFGCDIALRHVQDERELQQRMAVFTNKADEIAGRLGNWSLRERVFTMEYARRQRFTDWTGLESEWTIDAEDVRVITGTMGRFPAFHRTGWRILRSARVIAEN